jgi:uncharacterized RDD family membrane protein YckC
VSQVVTGDAVVLEVTPAGFPTRMAALLIDMSLQITVLVILLVVIAVSARQLDAAAVGATLTVAVALVIVGYPAAFETLSRGKTLGKMAMGLRVVADDGGPERFRQALIRALAGIFEIWSIVLDPVALLTSLASAKGKRVGDMFAGTYVIQERAPRRKDMPAQFAMVPPPLAGWAAQLELSGLPDRDAEAASSYLRRFFDLQPAARDALGLQLAAAVAARVSPPPPPGTPPVAFLAAVLAVRRERDRARLAQQAMAQGAISGPGYGLPPGYGAAPGYEAASGNEAASGYEAASGNEAASRPERGPGQDGPAAAPGAHAPPR